MAKLDKIDGEWVNLEKPGGQVIFVGGGTVAYKGKAASDTGADAGRDPKYPMATIQAALNKCITNRGDTVVMLPGSITITAALTMTLNDVTLTGYKECKPGERPPCVIVNATALNTISIDADNCSVENLYFDDNVTTTTADTEVIQIVSSGTAATRKGNVIKNCFFDMEGAEDDRDVIRIGFDADAVAPGTVIDGNALHDVDQKGIVLTAGTDECVIRGNIIYDKVTANVMTNGMDLSGDNTIVDSNIVMSTGGTACIAVTAAEEVILTNNRLHANGANTIGITIADNAVPAGCGNFVIAGAAGNLIDFAAATDNYAGFNDFGTVTAADPSAGGFITPTVTGS